MCHLADPLIFKANSYITVVFKYTYLVVWFYLVF